MVPNGWKIGTIKELCTLKRGFDLPLQNRIDGNIPIYSANGITGYHNEAKVEGPNVVTGRSGTVGKLHFTNDAIWPLNTSLYVESFHKNSPEYVFRFLDFFNLKRFSSGTGVPTLNRNDVHPVKISIPPLPEQRKIAKILSTWDKAISTTERLIDNSKQQKKALMQQLLTGKKRLLDDSGKPFEGEWEEVKLGELIEEFVNGYAFTASNYKNHGIPIITMGNISLDGNFDERQLKQNFWEDDDALKKYKIKLGDLLIAMTDVTPDKNLIGRMTIVDVDKTFYLNQRVGLLKLSNKIDSIFLKYLSNESSWRKYSIAVSASGVQANMGTKDIKKGVIHLPHIDEQQKIASVLSNADQEIELLEQQLADLKKEKKALMQQLLTGKRRVKVDAEAVA